MKKRLGSLLLSAALVVAMAGSAGAARLTVAQGFDPSSLWPNATTNAETYNVGTPVVESLFWLDASDNQIKPLLALSYEQESPTSIVVKLRPDVKFSNGEPMNADAVIFSFNILKDPAQTPAYTRYYGSFTNATKIDDLTVRMETSVPVPMMALNLTLFFIVPPAYWTEVGLEAYGRAPIGTGPFLFDSWVRDSQVVFKKNENYWGEAPKGIDELVFRPVPDETARVAGVTTGEYDIASVPVTAVEDLRMQPGVQVLQVDAFAVNTLILSSLEEHVSPLQNQMVRQALNHAVDKQSIIDNLFLGEASRLNGQILRKGQLGHHPDLQDYEYDPEKAKRMLAEAGYPNGFEIGFKVPVSSYPQGQEVAEAAAGMLAEVGVRTNIQLLESGEYLRQLRARELWPMAMSGSQPPDDPHLQFSQYHSTWRYAYIRNAELDALIEAGEVEMDREKRAAIYREASELLRELAPVIFLYSGTNYYGASSRVKNLHPRGDARFFFYNVSLED
ncbi:MAG: ABC transporter substrate-binding protein [Microvirga sp.]|nr:ABC transporter substrate-binding protein [Microvirga sp.]